MIWDTDKWIPLLRRNMPVAVVFFLIGLLVCYAILHNLVLESKNATIENLQGKNASLEKALSEARSRGVFLETKPDRSKDFEQEIVALKGKLRDVDAQFQDVKRQLEAERQAHSQTQSQLASARAAGEKTSHELLELRRENEALHHAEQKGTNGSSPANQATSYTLSVGRGWSSSDGAVHFGVSSVYAYNGPWAVVSGPNGREVAAPGDKFDFKADNKTYRIVITGIDLKAQTVSIYVATVPVK